MVNIEGYQVIDKLGDGGMASVYRAVQESVGREVALKILLPHLNTASKDFSERFKRETKLLGGFQHPGIVTIHHAGQQGDIYFLAMECLNGGTLTDRIRKNNTIAPDAALEILHKVADALAHSHAAGVLHRDIKPDNILFRSENSADPVLADYGIAKKFDNSDSVTIDASIIGSPKYMSPEQALGKELTGKTDIFSLGVVFYEMVLGRVPFNSNNLAEIALAHQAGLPIEEFDSIALQDCQSIWLKMLEVDVGKRISAQDLANLLDNKLKSTSTYDPDKTVVSPVEGSGQSQSGSSWSTVSEFFKGESTPAVYATTASIVAIITGVVAWSVFQIINACCSIGQLASAISNLQPSYAQLSVAPGAETKGRGGKLFSGSWLVSAPGYETMALEVTAKNIPNEILLQPKDYFSPEEFYDYRAVQIGEVANPEAFIVKYPLGIFTPVANLIANPSQQVLDKILNSAKSGDVVAQFQLSEIYEAGNAPAEVNLQEAGRWATMSAKGDFLPAKLQVFVMQVQNGELLPGSALYEEQLSRLANSGFWLAQYLKANYLRSNEGKATPDEWLPLLEQAASAGDYKSHQELAEIYRENVYSNELLGVDATTRAQRASEHQRRANEQVARLLR